MKSKTCQSNCLLSLLPIVSLIKKGLIITCLRLKQPLRCNARLSGVNKAHSRTGRRNQSTSVHLSQAGDQIEKWIAWCAGSASWSRSDTSQHLLRAIMGLTAVRPIRIRSTSWQESRRTTSRCEEDFSLEAPLMRSKERRILLHTATSKSYWSPFLLILSRLMTPLHHMTFNMTLTYSTSSLQKKNFHRRFITALFYTIYACSVYHEICLFLLYQIMT